MPEEFRCYTISFVCGFAGEFVFAGDKCADLGLAKAMAARLIHRGPDEDGSYLSSDRRCAIAFRRLAVIDPAGSHQPMTSADGLATIAFNGEIYNFPRLRDDLVRAGASFRTVGDTEVLLHLYQRRSRNMLQDIGGMFAFAIHDSAQNSLFLARDRLGQKPLWYAILSDRIVFASEAKALLLHPMICKDINCQALTHYLTFGYIPAPMSAWSGIRKLLPGYQLWAAAGHVDLRPYWTVPDAKPAEFSHDEAVDLVRQRLNQAVKDHMISDVPLGALLSGGVDSSIVVALMCKHAGKVGGVRTFTAGFGHSDFDERPYARQVADHLGTQHTELLVEPSPAAMIDQIIAMYDEPFGDSSALPTWLICRQARKHVTVALVGDGGDEAFAGYDRYRAMQLASNMGQLKYMAIRAAGAILNPWAPQGERSRLRRFVRFADGLPHPFAMQYLMYRRIFSTHDLAILFADDFVARLNLDAPSEWFCDLYEQGDSDNESGRAQRHDLLTYLPDDLLVKTDRASMASSLELRAPMLDHGIVALGMSLPEDMKIAQGFGKTILRDAFADLLPPGLFDRPKRGFAVPLGDWLKNDLANSLRQVLMGQGLKNLGLFRPEAIRNLVETHISGRQDHRHRLWALLILAKWLEHRTI